MKDRRILSGILIGILIAFVVFIKKSEYINSYFSMGKLQFLINDLNEEYLYDIDEKSGEEGIYSGYLAAVENSSTYYLNKDQLEVAKIEEKGDAFSTGLGLMWSADQNYLIVSSVEKNSPADKKGIQPGDCIVKINDIPAIAANSDEIVQLIFSDKSEMNHYELVRNKENLKVDLASEEISLEEFSTEILMNEIIYIHLHAIKKDSNLRLKETLDKMDVNQYKGIILDLRNLKTNNAEEIYKISDLFLDEEVAFKVINKKEEITTYNTKQGSIGIPIVVLTNGGTSSGAEALVLALKEHAQIIGASTAGNPYFSKLVTFKDETGMSVASGIICNRYGEKLSKEGIEPDIKLYLTEEEKRIILERGYTTHEEDSYLQAALKSFC